MYLVPSFVCLLGGRGVFGWLAFLFVYFFDWCLLICFASLSLSLSLSPYPPPPPSPPLSLFFVAFQKGEGRGCILLFCFYYLICCYLKCRCILDKVDCCLDVRLLELVIIHKHLRTEKVESCFCATLKHEASVMFDGRTINVSWLKSKFMLVLVTVILYVVGSLSLNLVGWFQRFILIQILRFTWVSHKHNSKQHCLWTEPEWCWNASCRRWNFLPVSFSLKASYRFNTSTVIAGCQCCTPHLAITANYHFDSILFWNKIYLIEEKLW